MVFDIVVSAILDIDIRLSTIMLEISQYVTLISVILQSVTLRLVYLSQ